MNGWIFHVFSGCPCPSMVCGEPASATHLHYVCTQSLHSCELGGAYTRGFRLRRLDIEPP